MTTPTVEEIVDELYSLAWQDGNEGMNRRHDLNIRFATHLTTYGAEREAKGREEGVKSERERVLSVLESEGYLKGRELLPHNDTVKNHGSCCYCGMCGHFNDECVCEHNELLQALTTPSEDNHKEV